MLRTTCLMAATGLAFLLPNAALAQNAYADPASIDAEVAAFTGAAIGTPGGARGPVDRRLRMAACPQPLQIAWHGRGASMVRVECNAGSPWRVFVPVNAGGTASDGFGDGSGNGPGLANPQAPLVERGQALTITLQGRGFSISQQGEALEAGRVGEWIRIRPEGSREEVRARLTTPAQAVIALHG